MIFTWQPVQLSLFVAVMATALTLIMAVPVAYWLLKGKWKGKSILETIMILPLVLPPSVIGFMLIIMFGNNSFIGSGIQQFFGQGIMFTPFAAVLAAAVVAFPLMYQTAKAGFQSLPPDVEGAAKVDGATEVKVFFFISLPLATRALVSGMILSFTRALGEFGATLMFAGNIPGKTQTIPTSIYLAIESGQTNVAWVYVSISIGISVLFLLLVQKISRDS
ncbi:molybdate ABC transporter permease subunit [Peribacillus alkalitolerans]|uniref:molybdate ABC transporter permease subunit n=1 Tax=Peribacillus alkalitolerans TaxID=1550385 RepID=UPI0013D6184C|nr:molybdate ABC transporter permease subunit [Peribacillus alkalitolerans]